MKKYTVEAWRAPLDKKYKGYLLHVGEVTTISRDEAEKEEENLLRTLGIFDFHNIYYIVRED